MAFQGAAAQDAPVEIIIAAPSQEGLQTAKQESAQQPPSNETQTHPTLKLSPDKSEILRLDDNAGSVIIGNAAHLSVLAENARTLILVGKAPGATYLTVLDSDKNVIMQRHVIVGAPKENYVRIRKSCAGREDCQKTQVYYCPDTCHEVNIPAEDSAAQDNTQNSGTDQQAGRPQNESQQESQ
ncbi:MAG: pilus assembly protein N-terminal domain-containing protein [Bdellovibrionales bacterium]